MSNVCGSCRKPKAVSHCEICDVALCKPCTQFLDADSFSFLKMIPEELSHTRYCASCYAEKVEPALVSYREVMERAENLYVFFKSQKKAPPIIKRAREFIREMDRVDRDETILRLAFTAAEQGFNALVETEVVSVKNRNGGYQKSVWQGSAVPAQVDAAKVDRDFNSDY